jgi:teichuronic acid biosynthesis glycosyltransferase TuaG
VRNFFSIITPVYNAEAFLAETIQSVREQVFEDYEHILIDDGSTDSSWEICQAYAASDPRVKLLRSATNVGVSRVRNLGLETARGEYVCFLDSDDTWETEKLLIQKKQIEETGAKFLFSSYAHVREDGTFVKHFICPPQTDYLRMLSGSVVGCLTIAIHRDLLQGRAFRDINHEDYLLWLEIMRDHQLTAVGHQKPLARYRIRPNSRSAKKLHAARAQWAIYRRHLGLSLVEAIPNFIHYAWAGLLKHKKSLI